MAYSKEQMLERLGKGSATLGWGAVAAYSRSRLNRLLMQQYQQRLDTLSFLPPFSDELAFIGERATVIELEGLEFGTPRLSFINASLSNSRARLIMNLIAGRCTTVQLSDGALISTFDLTEAMGYTLELDLDLMLVTGEVDRHGRVSLDLAQGSSLRCNLLQDQPTLNQQLVRGLESWFHGLPARMTQFDLGIVELQGYHPLSPRRFIIRTQAAPGAKLSQAVNQGDGAVLVFIRVSANHADGVSPDSSYPYLIPDGNYSASLLLDRALTGYADGQQLETLNSLLFPGTYAFVEAERHRPFDMLVLGNIDPLVTTYTVEPAEAVIKAGEQLSFTLHDGRGRTVSASRWYAVSLNSHLPQGHGQIDSRGRYSAPSPQDIGHQSLTVVVTAELDGTKPDEVFVASARLQVSFESVAMFPNAASYWPGQQQVIPLAGWQKNAQGVQWSLLEPFHGELSDQDEHRALFVPDRGLGERPLVVQQVQAQAGQARDAALVMVNSQPLLSLYPAHVANVKHGQTAQLSEPVQFMPGADRRWRVLSGKGEVDQTGAFTSLGQHSGTSVVVCEVVSNGVVFASGHSVVQHSDLATEGSWKELNQFTVKVMSGQDGNRQGRQFNNGFQQLELEVFVETAQVGGKDYSLSVTELATLGLYHERTPERVTTLAPGREGIELGDLELWAVSALSNRFHLANGRVAAAASRHAIGNRQSTVYLYLHCRAGAGQTRQFYAGFQADSKQMHYTTDTTVQNSRIEVAAMQMQVSENDYSFKRQRVDGGGGDGDERDDFDFFLTTIDYWTFRYAHANFVSCEVLGMDGNRVSPLITPNISMVTWEGPNRNDRMFSYSGLIFHDPLETYPTTVLFDKDVEQIRKERNLGTLAVDSRWYASGSLVLVNLRREDVYRFDIETSVVQRLTPSLVVLLRDEQGNNHYRRFSYLPTNVPEHRNYFNHISVSPQVLNAPQRPVLTLHNHA
ncbi:hypothetical protein [Pseudomonas fulva]|uniref:hypothetical protein n=1 Tax=Pseudomonas fulva TaxID=47880 RepID=UPI0018A989C8|nr:hypothetical protein [Pseudomonas fulva]MBF8777295.1 hypothetical protein [Pseudomonas fulva]